jgi:inosine-uridine nucleoside N-ribohydrolase
VDGVQALIDAIMASKDPVTPIAFGPAPNLEVALQREPRLAQRARFVGMYGSLYRGYPVGRNPRSTCCSRLSRLWPPLRPGTPASYSP